MFTHLHMFRVEISNKDKNANIFVQNLNSCMTGQDIAIYLCMKQYRR